MAIGSIYSSTMRLSGLQSGFDTESIVKGMLKIDQMKVDKQYKIKTKLEWKESVYNDINAKIKAFREKYFSALNSSENVFTSAAYNIFNTELTGESKDAVSITAGSTAASGRMTIEVLRLAEAASAKSQNVIEGEVSLDASLADVSWALDEGIAFDENGEISFALNSEVFTFNKDTTLSQMIVKVNEKSIETGVKVSWSSLRKGFMFTADKTGGASVIEIENIKGNAFGEEDAAGVFGIKAQTYQGQNAKAIIDGITIERDTNSFSIDGISYTLKAATTSEVTFNIERDIEATVDRIANFIDAYNELVKDFQGIVTQRVNFSYQPLSEEEAAALSEEEAKKWNDTAKQGILRNDSALSGLLSGLRSAFYEVVEGTGLSAAEIGLTTSANYLDGGTIMLDKDRLRSALGDDPERVMSVFVKTGRSEDAGAYYKESGLITRIHDAFTACTSSINDISLATNKSSLKQASDKLDSLQLWLYQQEERYWSQFAAMETALSSMNTQTQWLESFLSQNNNSNK